MSFKLLIVTIAILIIVPRAWGNDTPKYVGVWKFNSEKTLASILVSKDVHSNLSDVEKYGHMLLYPENFRIMFTTHGMGYIGPLGTPKDAQLAKMEVLELDENQFRFTVENLYRDETDELILYFEENCIYWTHKWNFNYYFCTVKENS